MKIGENCFVDRTAQLGKKVRIGHNCIIEGNVTIEDDCIIGHNTIIHSGVKLGRNSIVGANCILGEYLSDYYRDREYHSHPLLIGENALIRSGTILYGEIKIGNHFQTGHRVTIREETEIGENVSVGTLSDIQGKCKIGNYVRLHSNVHIGQLSKIDDFVWIYPYTVLTNDPTPPSESLTGVHINSFAIIATASVIMPGLEIASDALVAAGSIVTKNVEKYTVVAGNPAKPISDVRNIIDKKTGDKRYPWRFFFNRSMPWEMIGFEQWYNSLNPDKKEALSLTREEIFLTDIKVK